MAVLAIFRIRRDTAANWTTVNPTLALGEPGLETDTRRVKYGDGATAWNALDYAAGGGGAEWGDITGTLADQADLAAALGLKAPLASPALTGNPTAPTQAAGNSTTRLATTEFVSVAIADLVGAAPGALDTLNELADALGDDPNFATTVTNALALKAPLANPSFTGTITGAGALTIDGNVTLGNASSDQHVMTGRFFAVGPAYTADNDFNVPHLYVLSEGSALGHGARLALGSVGGSGLSYLDSVIANAGTGFARLDFRVRGADNMAVKMSLDGVTGNLSVAGNVTVGATPAPLDNSLKAATTAYVDSAVATMAAGRPLLGTGVFDGVTTTFTFLAIPNTYNGLELDILCASGPTVCSLRFNNDSGANYQLQRTGHANGPINLQSLTQTSILLSATHANMDFRARCLNYLKNAVKLLTAQCVSGGVGSGTLDAYLVSGSWNNTAAVVRVDVIFNTAPPAGAGYVRLFGVL
jgi:hypothetical protein